MKKFFIIFTLLLTLLIIPMSKVTAAEEEQHLYKEQIGAVQVFNVSDKTIYITDEDVYLMSQIVYAESRSEPYEGKVAVASVILNRLKNPGFPKSVEGVIKQKGAFSCLKDGKIDVVPDKVSYSAVIEALKGNDPTNNAIFFYNPKIATSTWMKQVSKSNVKPIGNHVFFVVNK
ncbi:cell wall hydrolase [Clostridium sp. YIM B02515]|uniref:Cell wall hydrolase n=1 Tax=Clostridium rhizosphaerae TaxID=2803861 RepID=A0ABS1TA04_9CLOT|nr:cell wall hydrolase [Clostridium rhizosphaerae]MBL4936086.1 cell wall hydrolase [Clostridium rhizosphaerae]